MDPDRLMVDTAVVGSSIPHLISDRSRVVLGKVRLCTPIGWLGRLERTSESGEEDERPAISSWPTILAVVLESWCWRIIPLLVCVIQGGCLLEFNCSGSFRNWICCTIGCCCCCCCSRILLVVTERGCWVICMNSVLVMGDVVVKIGILVVLWIISLWIVPRLKITPAVDVLAMWWVVSSGLIVVNGEFLADAWTTVPPVETWIVVPPVPFPAKVLSRSSSWSVQRSKSIFEVSMLVDSIRLLLLEVFSTRVVAVTAPEVGAVAGAAGSLLPAALAWSTLSWWTLVFLCLFRSELVWNPLLQCVQKWGRSPVCVYRCFRRWVDSLNLK